MMSLEAGVCKRRHKGRQADQWRTSRGVGRRRRWQGSCPNGWENDRVGTCWQECRDRHPAGEWTSASARTCRHRCPLGWKSYGGFCYRPCNFEDYPGFQTTCGHLYCTVDTKACQKKSVEIGLAFADMLSNLAAGVYGPVKNSVKTYAKKGLRAAVKKALIAIVKKYAKKWAKNLVRNEIMTPIKQDGKRLAQSEKDEILEGGALNIQMTALADTWKDPDLKQMARDADPTGIANVVESFNAHDCEKLRLTKMPKVTRQDTSVCSADRAWWCPRYKAYCRSYWFQRYKKYCLTTCCGL